MRISTRIGHPETYPPSRFGVSFGPFSAAETDVSGAGLTVSGVPVTGADTLNVFRPLDTNRDLIIERVFLRADVVGTGTLKLQTVDSSGTAKDTGLSQALNASALTSGVELALSNEFEMPVIEGDEWLALNFSAEPVGLENLSVVAYFRDYDYS